MFPMGVTVEDWPGGAKIKLMQGTGLTLGLIGSCEGWRRRDLSSIEKQKNNILIVLELKPRKIKQFCDRPTW